MSQVKDIKFSPRFIGLTLAAACSNGEVKFFNSAEIDKPNNFQENLGSLQLKSESILGCNCIAWSTAFDESPMIIVGCEGKQNNNTKFDLLQLYKYEGSDKKGSFKQYGEGSF